MKTRIEFVDQLKGLAMLMVVFGHLLHFAFNAQNSPWDIISEAFDLPLFFFVSGYFCIKSDGVSWKEFPVLILKRMRAYVLPLISVGTLYCVLTGYSFQHLVLSGGGQIMVPLYIVLAGCNMFSGKQYAFCNSMEGKAIMVSNVDRSCSLWTAFCRTLCIKSVIFGCAWHSALGAFSDILSLFHDGYSGEEI